MPSCALWRLPRLRSEPIKAAISAISGTLIIKPESGTEAYALRKWEEDWRARKVKLTVTFLTGINDPACFTEMVNEEKELQAGQS